MTPQQEAAWLARQRPATEWTANGALRPVPSRRPTPDELDHAMELYRSTARQGLRAKGWFDDAKYARCVAAAMGEW